MKFLELAKFFQDIEDTSSRLKMTEILSQLYCKASGEEPAIISYLINGRVSPMFVPAEYNISTKTIVKVLQNFAINIKPKVDALKLFKDLGDLGLAAEKIAEKANQDSDSKTGKLNLQQVYDVLWEIALTSGARSVEIRSQKIYSTLTQMSSVEAKYFIRILAQTLRLGSSSRTVLDALSVSVKKDKSDRDVIEHAFGVCSDLGYVAEVYLKSGRKGLEEIHVVPGIPVFSMLVERDKDFDSIMKRMPEALIQPKFDGLRCQIHIGHEEVKDYEKRLWWRYWSSKDTGQTGLFASHSDDKIVKLFSRNLEDLTGMFPEVAEAAKKLPVESAIFDAEVIGYNDEAEEYAKFQQTMTRKRKYAIEEAVKQVPVKAFVFDILFLNDKSLLDVENEKRIETVEHILPKKDLIVHASTWKISSANELKKLFEENVSEGLEGIIIKDPKSHYKPGKRGFDWIKLKRASQGQLADSVDVVIVGYYTGRGKHAVFGIGALLGAIYDRDTDKFDTVTKIGTGITDEQWHIIKHDLDKIKVASKPKQVEVEKALLPDQWVNPQIVSTVEADEITRSPIHTAGKDQTGVGFALRFPRLKVWKRDRLPDQATTVKELIEMYDKQGVREQQ